MKSYKLFLSFLMIVLYTWVANAAEPVRKTYVVVTVNGTEYQPEQEIIVRPGEKIIISAKMQGGKRDYCSMPEKYANIGRTTVIESKSEDGMSFHTGEGQFRGVWNLSSEIASYKSDQSVKIEMKQSNLGKTTDAFVQVPTSGFSKIFIKVKVETNWHYVRNTPGGKHEEDLKNEGESTFYLKIEGDAGAWYNSANISVVGEDNFSVRNNLDEIQRLYGEIANNLKQKDFPSAESNLENLKGAISNLKTTIEDQKNKNPNFQCDVTFIGLPTNLIMQDVQKFQLLADKWKEMYLISQTNVSQINNMLLNVQNGFSANVLRSVFKNYINWGTSIPTGAFDLLTIYDPNNVLGPVDLPRKVMGWWEDANNDAGILKNQVQSIKMLSQLRKFYLEKMEKNTDERKQFFKVINELKPAKMMHESTKIYMSSLPYAKWKNR